MKRRRIITLVSTLGLAVLLTVALLTAFVGPASASTSKTVNFEATGSLFPVTKDPGGAYWNTDQWVYAREWKGPDGVHCLGDWLSEGIYFLPPSMTGSIPFLTGFIQIHTDLVEKEVVEFGNPAWAYMYDSGTLYVGCDSMADVTSSTPVWKEYSFGIADPDGTINYIGAGYGISGAVKGWEMHWTAKGSVWYALVTITGYYIAR